MPAGTRARGSVTPVRERSLLAAMALAALAAWALVPTYPDYDAYHHLVWGRDLLHGVAPGFEGFAAPTEHPLYLALGALLSLFGEHADRLLVLTTMLSLVALVAGAYVLGRELFGPWPALLGALFVGSSFAFLLYAVRAFVDVPFLALVVWAAALEAARPRRGALPLALLAAAGLLRPEAWVLAGVYWLWCLGGRDLRARLALLGLVALAPVCWALVDLAVTGDPLYSLHATSRLAEALGRVRGIEHVPRTFVTFLADVARPPVALAGVIGLGLAVRRFGVARMAVPIALLGTGALTFVVVGIAGLAILQRYLTVPAVALCVLAGYAVLGFTTLPPGPARARWRAARRWRARPRGGLPRDQGGELLRAALGAAVHRLDALAAARAARRAGCARGPALRRADVPDLPPGPRRALDARRRRRSRALARRGSATRRGRRLPRRRREVRAALRPRGRRQPADQPAALRRAHLALGAVRRVRLALLLTCASEILRTCRIATSSEARSSRAAQTR